jgi:hypothetical protein
MKTKYLLFTALFLIGFSVSAQSTTSTSTKKPASIYSFSNVMNNSNSFSAVNKKLRLLKLDFVIVDQIDIDTRRFSIDVKDIGKTPTAFIYDDYRKYQDENLLKGFLEKNDPSYWNLQCPQPNLHPYE